MLAGEKEHPGPQANQNDVGMWIMSHKKMQFPIPLKSVVFSPVQQRDPKQQNLDAYSRRIW